MNKKYYKAFKKGMKCMGKQYAENTEYEEKGGKICSEGMMHFCETPFDTLDYYPLVDENGDFSEWAEVEPLDQIKKKDNKCASKKIRIGARLSFKDFIKAGVDVLIEGTKGKAESGIFEQIGSSGYGAQIGSSGYGAKIGSSGDYAQIGSSGNYAQIGSSGNEARIGSSGDYAQIGSSGIEARIGSSGIEALIGSSGNEARIGSSGDYAQIGSSGNYAQIGSSGDCAKIGSSGYGAQIGSSGYGAKIGSSGYGAQIGSSGDYAQIGSSGNYAQIGSSGDYAKIGSSGNRAQIKMHGARSIAAAVGMNCVISGKKGSWIVLAEWKEDEKGDLYPACVKAGQIDGETLKEDTMYTLKGGEFTEI